MHKLLQQQMRSSRPKPLSSQFLESCLDIAALPSGPYHTHYQTFHGAWPFCHRSSSTFLSCSVSMGCQNPSCLNAASLPSAASLSIGCFSQLIESSSMYSMTPGSRTKKPLFTQAPSPSGFSLNDGILFPFAPSFRLLFALGAGDRRQHHRVGRRL